ncbi:FAD-dependent oxidoreductase [Pseudoalteromonas fuliginea]|uniref:NAD(P)/FAD-dependent oxidoreductase n=1 Tax=Pseudoalteromonas TaxID=53246 RepID=UPI0002AADA77|nr:MULTISPECIES: FAD-dependent oxidoreductase [unclassified Pseudoalteromonas]ALQ08261.1 pyridine nucleotide-disulfide oxidoreductase [Pseudoalteromonas sp. Bsw20308]ATG77500.1 pyridine nucleotide-disulfide oxidoreductase [Pseudoalteromonas sp. 1_2015MBL_MicDiv]
MQNTHTEPNLLEQSVVVIGASHGGVNFAFTLRQQGWLGKITLLDSDPELPYHRPPLSKKTLQSDDVKSTPLKVEKAYTDSNIDLCLGQRVTAINKQSKTITLKCGKQIAFHKLVIATGCSPFIPPIKGLIDTVDDKGNAQYFAMRTHADAVAIKTALNKSNDKQVVIIGGGYIGLESASSFIALGAKVTVIEKQQSILSRVTSAVMSDFLTQLHISKGVDLQTAKDVVQIKHTANKHYVVCSDGTQYPADFILVGVGVRLNTELAVTAELALEQGIKVNEVCQTSHPDIFSIGDCTSHFNKIYQRWIRLESVQNAVEQAKTAAQFLAKNSEPVPALPWFWSDQYEYKLQIVGLSQGYNEIVVREESPEQFSLWYFNNDTLLCVEAVNHAKAYVLGTQAIKQNIKVNKRILSDLATPLAKQHLLET